MREESFGSYLRVLRQARGRTQAQLAAQSGIALRTLVYWEAGSHAPGAQELEGIAHALGLTTEERQMLLTLLPLDKAGRLARVLPALADVAPPPSMGDLIRALRWRRRVSRDGLADAMGVHRTTLNRWEHSRNTPTADMRQRLCDVLGALPAERAVLMTESQSAPLYEGDAPTLDVCRLEAARLERSRGREAFLLYDLRAHLLAGTLWHLMARQPQARLLLAQTYAAHAVYACIRGDNAAALDYSSRSLGLFRVDDALPKTALYGALWASGHALAHRAPHLGTKQSLKQAKEWLLKTQPSRMPVFLPLNAASWALRSGSLQEAREYGRAANVRAEQSQNLAGYDYEGLQSFRADLLVGERRYEAAMEAETQILGESYYRPLMRCLFQTSVFLKMGAKNDADNSLRRAYTLIEADQADFYRREADELAAQLEQMA